MAFDEAVSESECDENIREVIASVNRGSARDPRIYRFRARIIRREAALRPRLAKSRPPDRAQVGSPLSLILCPARSKCISTLKTNRETGQILPLTAGGAFIHGVSPLICFEYRRVLIRRKPHRPQWPCVKSRITAPAGVSLGRTRE